LFLGLSGFQENIHDSPPGRRLLYLLHSFYSLFEQRHIHHLICNISLFFCQGLSLIEIAFPKQEQFKGIVGSTAISGLARHLTVNRQFLCMVNGFTILALVRDGGGNVKDLACECLKKWIPKTIPGVVFNLSDKEITSSTLQAVISSSFFYHLTSNGWFPVKDFFLKGGLPQSSEATTRKLMEVNCFVSSTREVTFETRVGFARIQGLDQDRFDPKLLRTNPEVNGPTFFLGLPFSFLFPAQTSLA
jgi:hypothetical protein